MNEIKKIRNTLGMSIYKVAEKTELTPSYISNLENGKRVNPSKDVMEKIAGALNESVQAVFFPESKELS